MQVAPTAIPEVKVIHALVREDTRGFFLESWNSRDFARDVLDCVFVQDNLSRSRRGTLRGLHYQIEQPQGKLIRAVTGQVFDVAVDLRRSAATFGQCVGATLSDENHDMLWIPPGFGHGFVVLSESADLLYKCTEFYAPQHERTILWNDTDLAIEWPIPDGMEPLLSPKDRAGVAFRNAEVFP